MILEGTSSHFIIKGKHSDETWMISDIGNTDGIEYRPAWRHTGSDGDKSWRYVTFHPHAADSDKSWTKINNFKFTFINLFPYTNYTFKVDTRIQVIQAFFQHFYGSGLLVGQYRFVGFEAKKLDFFLKMLEFFEQHKT